MPRAAWESIWSRRGSVLGALPLLLALVAPALLLMVAHQLHARGVTAFASPHWDVDRDRSWIEVLGYLYVGVAALLLLFLARRTGAPVYAAWAVALSVVLLDDAAELHERGGGWLAGRLDLPEVLGLRGQDLGELLAWAVMGAAVVAVLAGGHLRSRPAVRRDSWSLAALVVYLMVFAVGVDLLHISAMAVLSSGRVDVLLVFLEAAGELSAMAAFLAFAVHVLRRRPFPVRADADIDVRERTGPR